MAKPKTSRQKKKSKSGKRMPRRAGGTGITRMRDIVAVADYTKLLLDPCNAALVKPLYAAASGTTVLRKSSTLSYTNGFQLWLFHPAFGLFNGGSSSNLNWITYDASTTDGRQGCKKQDNPPYLVDTVDTKRGVAGCLSISWIAAESARQGQVYCGIISGQMANQLINTSEGGAAGTGYNTSPSRLVGSLPSFERMPVDKCEINWVPGAKDTEFLDPIVATTASGNSTRWTGTNWAAVLIYNVTEGSGSVTVKATYVTEVIPDYGSQGFVADAAHVPDHTATYLDVLKALQRKDSAWYLNTFKKIGNLVSGGVSSYSTGGLPGLLGYLVSNVNTAGRSGKPTS